MANIVVTSTTNSIKVLFNDMSSVFGIDKGLFNRNHIAEVVCLNGGGVLITMLAEHSKASAYVVSFDGNNNGAQVDTIDGVSPSSDSDLCDKIGTLIIS